MTKSSLILLSITGASLVATGCDGGPDGVSAEELGLPVETMGGGPTVNNGADPPCLEDPLVGEDLERFAAEAVSSGYSASGIPMLPALPGVTAACRKIIQDVVECALGDGQSVMDPLNGAIYTGKVGLAEEWERAPLDATQRRWVSACMIQRLNYLGLSIPILLEGNEPTILIDPEQRKFYPFAESTAWGDIFTHSALGTFGWICTEEDVWSICPRDLGEPWIDTRVCDGVQNCGIAFAGRCSDACTLTAAGYWDCTANYGFAETIRVRMQTNTHPPILGACQ